jgi:hypothetical protein
MFTDELNDEQVNGYKHLLGTRLLSRVILTNKSDRDAYLSPARECRENVFSILILEYE